MVVMGYLEYQVGDGELEAKEELFNMIQGHV